MHQTEYVKSGLHKKGSFPLSISSVNVSKIRRKLKKNLLKKFLNGKLHFLCSAIFLWDNLPRENKYWEIHGTILKKNILFLNQRDALHKIPWFYLISCCESFSETYNFCKVSGESPETLRNLNVYTNFLKQEIC